MEAATDIFTRLRPRLLGVAYRMLGSLAEAEDVVQDAWLSWHASNERPISDLEGWLVTATSRRAIDRLRQARNEREHYVGIWLPEPILTQENNPETPEQLQETSSNLSIAFLAVLERLSPEARAAFLMREVLDADYSDIAKTFGKNEAAVRQIVHRAKNQVREEQPRYVVSAESHKRLMRRFVEAWSNSDLSAMKEMMAESATLVGDGGGIVTAFPTPMVGGARIAQLLFASKLRHKDDLRIELVEINGRPGILQYFGDELESAQSYDTDSDGKRITHVYVQRNPEKLRRILDRQTIQLV